MTKWQEVKLGDICDVKGGKRLPKGINLITTKNTHPYIRVQNLGQSKNLQLNQNYEYIDDETQKTISRYIVSDGDLLMSIVGTIGLVGIVGKSLDKANLTENCVKIINLKNVDRDFLYYFLISIEGQSKIQQATVGAVQAKLPIKNIENLLIILPPLDVQKKIAGVLSALDDKIELNNKMNENLEAQAQALFKSWFVDFEPFGGKMPNDWKMSKIGDITTIYAGGDKPSKVTDKETSECNIPIYSNGIDNKGLYGFTQIPKILNESVTISARGTIGFVCLRLKPYVPIVRLISVEPDTNIISAKYLYFALLNANIQGTGTTQQQLTVPYFKNTEILVPSYEIVGEYTNIVNPFYSIISENDKENERLTQLRNTLLPKLMNGEIDVENVKID